MQCHTYTPCNQRGQPSTSKSQLCLSKQASKQAVMVVVSTDTQLGHLLVKAFSRNRGLGKSTRVVLSLMSGGREGGREGGRGEGGGVSKDFPHFSKVHTSPVQFVVVPLHVQFVCVDQESTPPHNTTWREGAREGGREGRGRGENSSESQNGGSNLRLSPSAMLIVPVSIQNLLLPYRLVSAESRQMEEG